MSKLVVLPAPIVPMPADRVIVVDELVTEGYQFQPLYELRVSPDNRKWFNEQTLNELAESMLSVGVLQPIVIRPVPITSQHPQRFEIVAGERRFRAAIIAKLAIAPVIVKRLNDQQAAEIRLLENIQREDPHPLEEADSYQALMQAFNFGVPELMKITKKSKAYIYASLKLCALSLKARELFMADKEALPASTALLVARIPVPELQNRALDEIMTPRGKAGAMSVREAKDWIQERYMLNLKKAAFPIKDAKLLPEAGSCTACPKRAGNQPEVFQGIGADVCTDPNCFADKGKAHQANEEKRQASVEVQARKAGIPVFEGDACRPFYNRIFVAGFDEVGMGTPLYTFKRVNPKTKMEGNVATYLRADDMPPAIGYLKEASGLAALYSRAAVQAALEAAGACLAEAQQPPVTDQADASAPDQQIAVQDTAKVDAHVPSKPEAKESVAAATTRRTNLYLAIRGRAQKHGMSTQLLRELTKLLLRDYNNNCTFPDDLIGHLFNPEDFGGNFSDEAVCKFIDNAPMAEVQLLLMDIVVSEQLSAGLYDKRTDLAERTLDAMDVAMPDAASDEAPVRKTLTLTRKPPAGTPEPSTAGPSVTVKKTRVIPPAAWPFPTPSRA
ncbi:ParB/RepB/Spo0J family partition protein [Duganella dendranthematis]|uniref:ParB/RepB/Spo0J family partition protein n=1 Tax=Duganella dendranthematis TaxID=2728021 RepID=A0ABX6MD47_9BURK|nr:ParB/RepB/Spo0J family partition protein [Duganella dendranthematis]QJD91782.1 ParB/RepB/Spo0J family partition protein [Duganella dendranthematis]